VGGSKLARTFFTSAALVGAAMCSAFERGSLCRWRSRPQHQKQTSFHFQVSK
jgi:hypothetical protein